MTHALLTQCPLVAKVSSSVHCSPACAPACRGKRRCHSACTARRSKASPSPGPHFSPALGLSVQVPGINGALASSAQYWSSAHSSGKAAWHAAPVVSFAAQLPPTGARLRDLAGKAGRAQVAVERAAVSGFTVQRFVDRDAGTGRLHRGVVAEAHEAVDTVGLALLAHLAIFGGRDVTQTSDAAFQAAHAIAVTRARTARVLVRCALARASGAELAIRITFALAVERAVAARRYGAGERGFTAVRRAIAPTSSSRRTRSRRGRPELWCRRT